MYIILVKCENTIYYKQDGALLVSEDMGNLENSKC